MKVVLNKIKLSGRLLIAPLTVVMFLVVVGVVSYYELRTQKAAIDNIFSNRKTYQVTKDIANIHAGIYKVISWANAKYDDKKIDDLGKQQLGILERSVAAIDTLEKSGRISQEEKDLCQAVLGQLQDYQKTVINAIDLATSDLNIATMYMAKADDKYQGLDKSLQNLLDLEDTLSQKSYDHSLESYSSANRILFILVGVAIGTSILISFLMSRSIVRPINRVVQGLSEGADQVASSSGQISSASQQLAEGASEQAAAIEETSSSIEGIASMTRHNAQNASQARDLTKSAGELVQRANHSMSILIASMAEISGASEDTHKIIKTIDEIAFQTNLLALNAAVEAARAGEAGAGFAVVADEVRNLAMRAADAAKSTAGLIEGTVKKVKEGSALVAKTNEEFIEVAAAVIKSGELVGEIAAASQEQAQGIDQVNRAVSGMGEVTQQNSANAEESASASEEMNAQAEQMRKFVADLVALMDGRRKGKERQANPAGKAHSPVPVLTAISRKAPHTPGKNAARGIDRTAIRMVTRGAHPQGVISFDDGKFEDF